MNDNMNNILLNLINQANKNKNHEALYDLIGIVNNSDQVRDFTN